MKKVYAVSSGSYSDYGVHVLFEREEDADAHVAAIGDYYVGTEEFWICGPGEQPEKRIQYTAQGHDLASIRVSELVYWDYDAQDIPERPRVREHRVFAPVGPDEPPAMEVIAVCGDRDAAIKAVKDRLAEKKAISNEAQAFVDGLNEKRRGMGLPDV